MLLAPAVREWTEAGFGFACMQQLIFVDGIFSSNWEHILKVMADAEAAIVEVGSTVSLSKSGWCANESANVGSEIPLRRSSLDLNSSLSVFGYDCYPGWPLPRRDSSTHF